MLGHIWGMRDLVPWPGTEPWPPALGVWSLSHWITREVPKHPCFEGCHPSPTAVSDSKVPQSQCLTGHPTSTWFKSVQSEACPGISAIALISHASKVTLKILQARLQQSWNVNFQIFKLVLEKAEEPEIKLTTSTGSSKKQESSRKISISALLTMPKPLTVGITINCEKFWKRWEYQTTWPASWETCMQVMKQQWELDMEQQTGSK